MASKKVIDSTTQKFLDIFDITNDLVILKDGTSSVILTIDAMNFGLLAEEEQDSIMYAYAGLLNSLNYPIQIIIRSQTKDVTGYLKLIKEQEDAVRDRTQQRRIMKYREFVSNLIRERNVLDKKFYIAIPAKPLELGLVPVSSVIPGTGTTDVNTVDKSLLIEKARSILEPKRDHLIAQFARIGLYSRQLETQEIIQLFYSSYNPEAYEGQGMDDSKSYTAPLVSASIEGSPMNMQDQSNQQPAQPVQNTQQPQQPTTNQPTAPQTPQEQMQPQTPQSQTDQGGGYTPTQMPAGQKDSQQSASANNQPPTTPKQPTMNESNPQETQTNASSMSSTGTESESQTPLPPTPELPKTKPGEADPAVPQETEITIQKPTNSSQPTTPQPQKTNQAVQTPVGEKESDQTQPQPQAQAQEGSNQTTTQQPVDQNKEMAPLPEIK